ncbi:MAG: hypothetical protein ACLRK7_08780 [Streptococcus salivarius]
MTPEQSDTLDALYSGGMLTGFVATPFLLVRLTMYIIYLTIILLRCMIFWMKKVDAVSERKMTQKEIEELADRLFDKNSLSNCLKSICKQKENNNERTS